MHKEYMKQITKNEIDKIFTTRFPNEDIIKTCKQIIWADGHHGPEWIDKEYFLSEDFEKTYYNDEIDSLLQSQQLLYWIVEKAKKDNFPIKEWLLFEIPYGDVNGQIWVFVNKEEYHQYHELKKKNVHIHSLDFYISYDGHVIPSSIVDSGNGIQSVDKDNCFDAVY